MNAISAECTSLIAMSEHMASDSLGIVDAQAFSEALQKVRVGMELPMVALVRTLSVELWLRGLVLWSGATKETTIRMNHRTQMSERNEWTTPITS
jgi:hypothetical protein